MRLLGLALYASVLAWCVWQLPTSLPFVAPDAAAGAILHRLKGRPWFGLLAYVVLIVVLPLLLAPTLGPGTFSDFANWFDPPRW